MVAMSTLHLSDTLLDGYVALFQQLAPKDQTILLGALTESAQSSHPVLEKQDDFPVYYLPKPLDARPFEELCGGWEDDRSAEEIVEDLRQSRTRTREVNL